jgi:flagellar FliJ protein
MSHADVRTLHLLLEREEAARDAAALALQQAEEQLARIQTQAEQFAQHRADYVTRWQSEFQRQGGVEILQCYRSFMQRLDQAVAQLAGQQGQTQATAARCRQRLVDAQTRVAALRTLIERREQALALVERRRDQKQTDEMAQRSAWMARAAALGQPALG